MQKEIKPIKGGLARSLLYFLTGDNKYLDNKKPKKYQTERIESKHFSLLSLRFDPLILAHTLTQTVKLKTSDFFRGAGTTIYCGGREVKRKGGDNLL